MYICVEKARKCYIMDSIMALHITNPDADRLLRALAAKTGKGLTRCLIDTLEEKLISLEDQRPDQDSRLERAKGAVARFRAPFGDEEDGEEKGGWGFGNRW